MSLVIRKMSPNDARVFLEVHHSAVREFAAKDYPAAVVDDWAQLPLTEEAIERVRANPDDEYRLIAEINGQVVGIGALVIKNSELRACYVAPGANRQGVGSALVREMERIARERGLAFLDVDSSITAEPLYAALGYQVRERGKHVLRSGRPMACVKMRKELPLD